MIEKIEAYTTGDGKVFVRYEDADDYEFERMKEDALMMVASEMPHCNECSEEDFMRVVKDNADELIRILTLSKTTKDWQESTPVKKTTP